MGPDLMFLSAPPLYCQKCGGLLSKGLGRRCSVCLNSDFLEAAQQRQGLYFRQHPEATVELAFDRHRVRHAVLAPFPKWAFCGAVPNQPKSTRKRVSPDRLPLELCARCRELVEREWKGAAL